MNLYPPDGYGSQPPDIDRSVTDRTSLGRRMTPQSPNEALQPEPAPPPPPRLPSQKRRRLSALSGFLSFVLIAAIAAMAGIILGEARLREPGPLQADKVVYIQKGDSEEIVSKLASEGVIDSPVTFQIATALHRLKGDKQQLKAGEYLFKRQASIDDVLATLVAGKQILHSITVPEGLTTLQVMQRLHDNDVLTGDIRETPKEGTILPETYKVARGTSRADLLSKMKEDQRRTIEQIWARRASDLPLRSPYELVTLASIVEKETGKADERSRVAAVFINRLKRRMRLQSDPTIVYGLVGGQGTLGHSISRAELDKPTPYNTYTIDGLPPGPIDNPGRAALEAVANPSRTPDLYFVADGTGGHAFAETIDQHVRNVQRWRQLERDAKEKATSDIDKVEPSAVPSLAPPRSNQRSDASGSVFGGLPSRDDVIDPKLHSLSFIEQQASGFGVKAFDSLDRAAVADAGPAAPAAKQGLGPAPAAAFGPSAATGPANAVGLAKTKSDAAARAIVLGPGFDLSGLSINGAKPSASDLLDGPVNSVSDDASSAAASEAAETMPAKQPPEHPKIYDVSEGTPLDPLREKNYDLNSAKTVPALGSPSP